MKVQIEKSYPMPSSPEVAWELLQDLEAVAGCMPGASITERLEGNRYKGTVAVKVGPASLSFRGEVEMKDIDAATHSLRLVAKGTDTSGSSAATMDISAHIAPAEGGLCTLGGSSEVSMSGKAASFGARLFGGVADQVLGQFASNFSQQVSARQAQRPAPALAAATELNGLAILWAAFRKWLRGLFSGKSAPPR